jgi:hypothetical protein
MSAPWNAAMSAVIPRETRTTLLLARAGYRDTRTRPIGTTIPQPQTGSWMRQNVALVRCTTDQSQERSIASICSLATILKGSCHSLGSQAESLVSGVERPESQLSAASWTYAPRVGSSGYCSRMVLMVPLLIGGSD